MVWVSQTMNLSGYSSSGKKHCVSKGASVGYFIQLHVWKKQPFMKTSAML